MKLAQYASDAHRGQRGRDATPLGEHGVRPDAGRRLDAGVDAEGDDAEPDARRGERRGERCRISSAARRRTAHRPPRPRRSEAGSEHELRPADHGIRELPRSAGVEDGAHEERPGGRAEPVARVQPVERPQAVARRREGIDARVDRPGAQPGDRAARHHHVPAPGERVSEQADRGREAAPRQHRAQAEPREDATAREAGDQVAEREAHQQRAQGIGREAERLEDRRRGHTEEAVRQADADERRVREHQEEHRGAPGTRRARVARHRDRGSPSTRSARMLRWISDVPAKIDAAR